eukprot:c35271_g1_i1 orf=2-286(-)
MHAHLNYSKGLSKSCKACFSLDASIEWESERKDSIVVMLKNSRKLSSIHISGQRSWHKSPLISCNNLGSVALVLKKILGGAHIELERLCGLLTGK